MITLPNHSKCGLLLLLALLYQSVLCDAQSDSLPAVITIFTENSSTTPPRFSPFCPDRCRLGEREFDLTAGRLVPKDSMPSCFSLNARSLVWMDDPFEPNYAWSYDYHRDSLYHTDSLIIWRYDRRAGRQDSFFSLYHGEMTIGKPGIWVTNQRGLVLLDRRTMQVLNRAGNPADGQTMNLQPWGDDVLVTARWLFQRRQNRYLPFFPLPADMQDCKSPAYTEFSGSVCLSMVSEAGSGTSCYLIAPDHPPVRLLFNRDRYRQPYMLAVNGPLVWFDLAGKVAAVDVTNGDSIFYAGITGERLPGDQNGRFLGFRLEQGLSFFDKYTCQFRVITKPYGFQVPQFTSDHRFIYLTYDDHWEIVQFSQLDTSFQRSSVLEEYEVFEQEMTALRKDLPDDFYPQYQAYLTLFRRYGSSTNPKIAAAWHYAKQGLIYGLYFAADTILERVADDYRSGRFDPSVLKEVVEGLFLYWSSTGALNSALQLLQFPEIRDEIENNMEYGLWIIDFLTNTQRRIDSVEQVKQSPDKRLYALGKIWWDYCYHKNSFRHTGQDPRRNFEQAHAYFRTLIRQYPDSPLADNAAYDTLYYVDYIPCCTDDETPPGNDSEAHRIFTQFLKDYPQSDRRPDALLRMTNAVRRGVYSEHSHKLSEEYAAQYLQIIETEYPEFARTSEGYQKSAGQLKARMWSKQWEVFVVVQQPVYRISDTIRVKVGIRNISRAEHTMDTTFLSRWHERLYLNLHPVRDKGCEELWGNFTLQREKTPPELRPVTLPPGGQYEEIFVLSHTSVTKNGYPGKFDLVRGTTYLYYMEYYHPKLPWLAAQARRGEPFRVE